MHRRAIILLLAGLVLGPVADAMAAGVDLSRIADWDIVLDVEASRAENYAAEELRDHLALAAEVRLPIVSKVTRPTRHIFVGAGAAMGASNVGFGTGDFGSEQLRIVIHDDNVAIAGGRPRGTLYGVYTFLEKHLGVRFLTREHTHIPPVGQPRVIGPDDFAFDPPFNFRWPYYGEVKRDAAFAAKVRCNTVPADDKYGGKTGRNLINHSFANQIPSHVHGEEHPEYFCQIDGQRLAQVKSDSYDNEPCLTNPDVLRIVTESVLEELETNPSRTNISVSQNDNDKYCRCASCAAIDEREGTPMGSLLTFVNGVADRVAETHPHVKIGTLSYWYTRQAPATVKPRPNVQIQLCSIECSMVQPLDDPRCKSNVAFSKDFRDWSVLCDDIAIWNYNTNFSNYLLPCPNLRVIEPNIRFFHANGIKAVFMQAAGNALGAELSELRNYMIANLLWDPRRSGRDLMDEFLALHYRCAAPPIRDFIELVHDNAEETGITKNCFGNAADYGIDASIVEAGLKAFDEAQRLADSDEVRNRVEKASICVHRAAIEDAWLWAEKHRESLEQHPLPTGIAARTRHHARRLFALCARHHVDRWSEGTTIEKAAARLRQAYGLGESENF